MKNIYTILLTLLIGASAFAQNISISNADEHFYQREYLEASEMYRLISDKNQRVIQNLADSYFYTNRMLNAEDYYRQLFIKFGRNIAPEYQFRFAQTLRSLGKQEEADQNLSEYFGRNVNFREWEKHVDTIAPYKYTTSEPMESESVSSFGISFLGDDKIVFASTRNKNRPIYSWNNQPYLDLYMADISEQGDISNIKLFPGEINTDTHESSATFTNDGKTMYFNRTNSKKVRSGKDKYGVAHVSIYRAELVDGEWTNIKRLPFASDNYSTEHPALNADGTKMYFSSDMPESIGSFDIYVVDIHEDGNFGEPRNLGPNINTPEREQFPFISDDDVLYFASNGRLGYGNLDIFSSEIEDGSFSEAKNLGGTINSGSDDFAYVLREGDNKGFFSSNRDGNEGLFAFYREENIQDPEKEEELEEGLKLPADIVEKNVKTGARQLKIEDIYFGLNTFKILPKSARVLDKVVKIMKEYPKLKIEIGSHADARGAEKYNLILSEKRAAATLEYIVSKGIDRDRLTSKGYGESMPLNNCTEETGCTKKQYAINRRSEFKILN